MPAADLSNPLVPEFNVLINGVALDATERSYISSILVDDSIAWPSMFALQFVSSFELPDVHQWIDYQDFGVGNKVEVKLGYGDKVESLIGGEITGLEPEFALDRPPTLTVRGYDLRYRLQKGRKTRTFVGLREDQIAEQIAREAHLSFKAEGATSMHDYVIQANQTDLEFLRERARRIQYELFVADQTVHFRPVQNDQSEVLTLTLGDHLLDFYPRLSMMRQVDDVVVLGWSGLEKREIVGSPEFRFESAQMGGKRSGPDLNREVGRARDVLSLQPVMSDAEADDLAQATLNQKALSLIEAEGTCLGRTDIRAGKVIKIDGIGQRFSGQYYVTSAVHSYSAQEGYRTQFQARRNSS